MRRSCSTHGYLTQNVQGFSNTGNQRGTWMASWKQRIEHKPIAYILIQETHVDSLDEAKQLETLWARLWGKTVNSKEPYSWWSVGDKKTGGIAILRNPHYTNPGQREAWSQYPSRLMSITTDQIRLINVYAPNQKAERDQMFHWLRNNIPNDQRQLIIGGDFNCVEAPRLDRTEKRDPRPQGTECRQLSTLISERNLIDAVVGSEHRAYQLTYWKNENGSRLDRFYIQEKHHYIACGSQIIVPGGHSDHLGNVMWARPRKNSNSRRPQAPTLYPHWMKNSSRLERTIGERLIETLNNVNTKPWDDILSAIATTLRGVKREELKKQHNYRKRREKKLRRNIATLQDLIQYTANRAARLNRYKRGRNNLITDTALLYRRLTEKRKIHTVTDITSASNQKFPPQWTVADKMADEWKALLGHSHRTIPSRELETTARTLYSVPPDRRVSMTANEELIAPITEQEVRNAIDRMQRSKAAGSDRLGNDFYKDWKELLIPTLTRVYNEIINGAEIPTSFTKAVIIPLRKKGDSSSAMDYRPISLLQTGYKIFTRVLAERMHTSLGEVITEDQTGFVRGRHMAHNIRLMQTILQQQYFNRNETAEDAPAIILVDLSKAYDTLDRKFVLQSLTDFGYDPRFVKLIERLHHQTTAQFLVNGELSHDINVESGIRQGCPLAPLLFLIAVEGLKYAIEQTRGIEGLIIPSPQRNFTHKVSAFVDDAAVFLKNGRMVDQLIATLQMFGRISGLSVQPTKSHAISLNTATQSHHLGVFPLVPVGTTVRYLGIEIGLGNLEEANWVKRYGTIQKRLGVLAGVTTGLGDRIRVINSIILPSILFTGNFHKPPKHIIRKLDQLIRTYLWKGGTTPQLQARHRLNQAIVHLPQQAGGMGVGDFRTLLLRQAGMTILQWNERNHDKEWATINLLLQNFRYDPTRTDNAQPEPIHTTPRHRTLNTSILHSDTTILKIGKILVDQQLALLYPPPAHIQQSKQHILQLFETYKPTILWTTHNAGSIIIPRQVNTEWVQHQKGIYTTVPVEIKSYWGSFNWYDNPWIIDKDGRVLSKSRFNGMEKITIHGIQLRWINQYTITFKNPLADSPYPTPQVTRKWTRWIQILIVNHAVFPLHPLGAGESRVYQLGSDHIFNKYEWNSTDPDTIQGTAIHQRWEGNPTPDTILAHCERWNQTVQFISANGSSSVHNHFKYLKEREKTTPIRLRCHPHTNHGPTLDRPSSKRQYYSNTDRRHRNTNPLWTDIDNHRETGTNLALARLRQLRMEHHAIHSAIQQTTFTDLWKKPWGVTQYQMGFRYRLIMGALSLRTPQSDTRGVCSTPNCDRSLETTAHVIWTCSVAQHTWTDLLVSWTDIPRAGINPHDYTQHCMQPHAPPLGAATRDTLRNVQSHEPPQYDWLQRVWKCICLVITHHLWLHRNERVFRRTSKSTFQIAGEIRKAYCNQLLSIAEFQSCDSMTRRESQFLKAIITHLSRAPEHHTIYKRKARLYYDGGARGNPGLAGAGALLLEQDMTSKAWTIVWWDSHFLGTNSTNNVAEHTAVNRGAHHCIARYQNADETWHVDVIGDSKLVTRQLQGTQAARHPHIRHLVRTTRNMFLQLPSIAFHHTYRSGNTAADNLANLAMDRANSLPLSETQQQQVLERLNVLYPVDINSGWTSSGPDIDLPTLILRKRTHWKLDTDAGPSTRKRRPPDRNIATTRVAKQKRSTN